VYPLQCKAITSARLKNYKVGAAVLAQLPSLRDRHPNAKRPPGSTGRANVICDGAEL
jgi:hypothetical protein